MNRRLIAPFLTWILLLVIDVAALIKGIDQRQSWRVTLAGAGMVGIIAFLYFIINHDDNGNNRHLKPVRIRAKNSR